jgi:apolipoprotein N-acyltransferase
MITGLSGWRALVLPALAGAALASGQAPLGWVWLAFPALIVLFYIVNHAPTRAAAVWAAWAGGAAYFGVALSWIVSPFFVDPVRHGWMAPFALLGAAFGFALFWAAAGWLAARTRHRLLGFAVALSTMELARGYILTGFPWALPGHMWIDTPLAQIAAYIGPNGLNTFTFLLAAIALLRRPWGAVVAVLMAVAAVFTGQSRLDLQPGPDRPVSVRLVQPNAAQHLKWDPDQARSNFARLLDLTGEGRVADLTIWPETAVPYAMENNPEIGQLIAAAAQGKMVITGIQRAGSDMLFYNALAVIAPDGTIAETYDKRHLVPFGEYIPFGDLAYRWFGIRAFASQVGNGYSPGPGPQVMDLGPAVGAILPLICYEAVFPQDLRAAPRRADWILQITNDAWFGTINGPWQHLAQTRFRAIEQGLPLLRVANTGVTAVIDAHGQVREVLPFEVAGVLDMASIPGPLPRPPYARFGEGPLLLLLAGLALALLRVPYRKVA